MLLLLHLSAILAAQVDRKELRRCLLTSVDPPLRWFVCLSLSLWWPGSEPKMTHERQQEICSEPSNSVQNREGKKLKSNKSLP